ncbi:MAG: hypothetical protein SV760_00155 [Halobacteria archaeon]|nr:hypothetical protein [Halobacteria archaeon]
MTTNDPTRRIPKKLNESDDFWRGYTLDDLLVGAAPFITAVLFTAYVLPSGLRFIGYILSVLALILGAIIIYATPDHLTSSEWLQSYVHYIRRPKDVIHVRYDFDSVREQKDFPESDFLELDERTQDLIDIERILKNQDAIERTDGRIIGAVRVEPANMALTTNERWADNVGAFTDFLNNSVEWPLQIYSTTTEFPVERYVNHRKDRLRDDDVKENPIFEDLIEYWLDWYPQELEMRGTNLREYYIIVPVGPDEIDEGGDEKTVLEKLSDVPLVGGLFGFFASKSGLSEEERRARMLRELDERLSMVRNEGIQKVDGCRAERVDSGELTRVLIEFWGGETVERSDTSEMIRTRQVVTGKTEAEEIDEARSQVRSGEEGEVLENYDTELGDLKQDISKFGDESETEDDEGDEEGGFLSGLLSSGDDETEDEEEEGRVTDDVSEMHKSLIAPSEIVFESDRARIGNKWVKSMWAEGYPDQPKNGFLERLFTEPGVETDVSIHVEPRDTKRAQDELKDRVGTLQAEYERKRERRDVDARGVQKDLEDAEAMFDIVRNTPTEVFDVSTYVNVRADTEEELESVSEQVRATLKRSPANVTPVTAVRRQDKGVRSTSPVAFDLLNKKSAMMGGAVGAMFPFSSSTLIEETGVEYGVHAFNGSPVIVDRFNRETGYNALVIGNIGSGKSFSTKLNLIRTLAQDKDTIVVMLDPLKGFVGVNEALGGERIVVGGNVGLNPLEIRETPDEVLEQTGEEGGELDPFGAKLKDVMSFFDTYFEMRDDPLKEKRGTLEDAVKQAYERKGITRDPDTHSNESPTVDDVMRILKQMAENPEEYTISDSEEERLKIEQNASELLIGMEPFTEGAEFENLSQNTEIDITDSKVVYLDLQQQETRGGTGLMMQLLFNAVYERAKEETDKRVVFAIDEARYIMKDASNLAFLEQAVRHSRHYDLSIQFITQTIDEFFAQEESEAIADNCSLKLLHRIEGIDRNLADEFDLTDQQMNFVRSAMAGDEEAGYSEALFGVADEGWYPIHVRANEFERQVIDFEPTGGDAFEVTAGRDEAEETREPTEEKSDGTPSVEMAFESGGVDALYRKLSEHYELDEATVVGTEDDADTQSGTETRTED